MKLISPISLKEKIDTGVSIVLMDIREPYEVDICSIQSLHIPMDEIEKRREEIPTNQEVVIFCKSGNRAEAVVNYLESKYNYDNLFLLEGGIMAWIEQVDQHLEKY